MNLQDSTIIVTGGCNGLGLATVKELNQNGAQVIVLDRDKDSFEQFTEMDGVSAFEVDLLNREQTLDVLNDVFEEFPKVHALVNNAGILYNHPLVSFGMKGLTKHPLEDWDRVLELNLSIPFLLSREVASNMIKTRVKGVLIHISSVCAQGNIGQPAYSAAKAGLEALSTTIAKELGAFKIRSLSIAPGYTDTESTLNIMTDDYLKKIKNSVPLRSLGHAENIATTVRFAIENDYLNGKTIAVDGGLNV